MTERVRTIALVMLVKPTNWILVAALACGMQASATGAEQEEKPNVEKLCELMPRITLQNEAIQSFEVAGFVNMQGMRMRYRVMGKQPDQLCVLTLDAIDNTPMMFGVNQRGMLYDPLASQVIVFDTDVPAFEFQLLDNPEQPEEDGRPGKYLSLGVGFKMADENENQNAAWSTVLDIPSFFKDLERPLELDQKNSQFAISGKTAQGNLVRAIVDPARDRGPLVRFELRMGGEAEPFLILDEISINQPIADENFKFPIDRLRASDVPFTDLKEKGREKNVLVLRRMLLAIMGRLAMLGVDDLKLKAKVEAIHGKPIDWDAAKENDFKHAPSLKKVFLEEL